MSFKPCAPELFFSKNDIQDTRLGDLVSSQLDAYTKCVLWGYPDDEGIRLNGGRPGAAAGPDSIRKVLYKMTPPLRTPAPAKILADKGNLDSMHLSLLARHEAGREQAAKTFTGGYKLLALGGGHDYGYCEATGFMDAHPNKDVVILNFDAHLDVRPFQNGVAHSGTPFFRLLSEFSQSSHLHFFEVGLQPQCNSTDHLQWLEKQGGKAFLQNAATGSFPWQSLQQALSPYQGCPLLVSFDIDCLSSAEAPGCSQSWPVGFSLKEVLPILEWLGKNFQWKGLGIYEVAPPLDLDNLTSKAAALLAHHFIFHNQN